MKSRLKRWFSQCLCQRTGTKDKTTKAPAPSSLVLLRSTPDSDKSSELHRLEYDGSVFSPTVVSPTTSAVLEIQSIADADTSEEDVRLLSKDAGVRYHIDLFHDGENCHIRMNTNGSLLFDKIIRNVLRAIGCHDADDIDIDAVCDVNWRFVLPISTLVPTLPLRDLLTRGVVHINPGGKKGAVDLVIMESMERLRNEYCDASVITKQKRTRIAVLISGDRDFAGPIRRLRQCGLPCVLIYQQQITPSFLHLLPPEMTLGIWNRVIEEAEWDSKKLIKQLSFREITQPCKETDGLTTVINENTKQDNALQTSNSCVGERIPLEVPDFKFQCAKDFYQFLMDRPDTAIEASQMHMFWNLYPEHRHDIGRIGVFCKSVKAEGWFCMTECPNGQYIVSLLSKETRDYHTANNKNMKTQSTSRKRRGRKGKGSNAISTTAPTPPVTAKQGQQMQQKNVMNHDQKTVVDVESMLDDGINDIEQCQSIDEPSTIASTEINPKNTSVSVVDKAAVIVNNDGHNRVSHSPWVLIRWIAIGLLFAGLLFAGLVMLDTNQQYDSVVKKIFMDLFTYLDKHLPQSQLQLSEMLKWTISSVKTFSLNVMNKGISMYNQWSVLLFSSAADAYTQLHLAFQSIQTHASTFVSDRNCHECGQAGLTYADVDIALWVSSTQQVFNTISTFINELPIRQYLPHQFHTYIVTIINYILHHLLIPIDTTILTNQSHRIVEDSAQFILTYYDLTLRQFHYNLTTVATNSTTPFLS